MVNNVEPGVKKSHLQKYAPNEIKTNYLKATFHLLGSQFGRNFIYIPYETFFLKEVYSATKCLCQVYESFIIQKL